MIPALPGCPSKYVFSLVNLASHFVLLLVLLLLRILLMSSSSTLCCCCCSTVTRHGTAWTIHIPVTIRVFFSHSELQKLSCAFSAHKCIRDVVAIAKPLNKYAFRNYFIMVACLFGQAASKPIQHIILHQRSFWKIY